MANQPDAIEQFTDTELWTLRTTLDERYGHEMELQHGEAELRLSRQDRHLTVCPVIAWQDDACTLAVFKCGVGAYRSQFYYRLHQQFGTGIDNFDNLAECVVTLLQVQADHHRSEQQATEAER